MDIYNMDIAGKPKLDIFEYSAVQQFPLGTRYNRKGRVFHYAKAGAAALVAGDLIQSAANGGTTTYQHDLTPSAAAKGASEVSVTTVTDTLTKNQFAGGYLAVTDGDAAAAMGDMYEIKSHPAGAAGAIVFTLEEPLKRAITTASRITIIKNLYDGVIQAPASTPSGVIVGVAPAPITAAYYGWLQTWGIANVLVKTALTAGMSVLRDVGAAGSVCPQVPVTDTAGTSGGGPSIANEVVGICGWVGTTLNSGLVFLTIAP